MDKLRGGAKHSIISQASAISNNKKLDDKFSDEEKKIITDLKKLYLETIKIDVDMQREIYNMEKSFEVKYSELFEKRLKILSDFRKKTIGDSENESLMTHFWMKVLKSSYTEFISKKDEKILMHLLDVRSKLYNEPVVKFVLEFYFEPNEYFSNRVLTKSYFLNCLPDVENPFAFDGAEICRTEGCKIDWKQNNKQKDDSSAHTSFFDFFNPPILPEDHDDPTYPDVNAILQNDFELGFYLKERVIPKAIMFFTGEIADCQSSDSESDDSDEEYDEDDDNDDSSGPDHNE